MMHHSIVEPVVELSRDASVEPPTGKRGGKRSTVEQRYRWINAPSSTTVGLT